MDLKPTVSVIIPTFNRSELLPGAIQSVLNQSYPYVEIIVVDDGSTDDTANMIKNFKDRVLHIATEHKGTAHARNVGMKAASGKYIAFLDSDDIYLPHKIELQVEFIESHPELGMVCTEFSGKYENGYIDEYHMRNYHRIWDRRGWRYDDVFEEKGNFESHAMGKGVSFYAGNIFSYILMDTLIPTNTILIPRGIIEKIGYQNEAYVTGQEYEYAVRICKYYRIGFLNVPTYVIVHHSGQSTEFLNYSSAKRIQRLRDLIETRSPFLGAVLEWGYEDHGYYSQNKEAIDSRLAEIYLEYAIMYLEIGDRRKARKQLGKYLTYDSRSVKYYILKFLSYMPQAILGIGLRILLKTQKWILLFKVAQVRGLSEALIMIFPQKIMRASRNLSRF